MDKVVLLVESRLYISDSQRDTLLLRIGMHCKLQWLRIILDQTYQSMFTSVKPPSVKHDVIFICPDILDNIVTGLLVSQQCRYCLTWDHLNNMRSLQWDQLSSHDSSSSPQQSLLGPCSCIAIYRKFNGHLIPPLRVLYICVLFRASIFFLIRKNVKLHRVVKCY